MVQVTDVHKHYGDFHVLNGINLSLNAGEVMCVVGPSGSGKSTMLRCINHLEKIDAGSIHVDGELVGYRERGGNLHEMKDKDVCRQRADVGMVFQKFNLFAHMTALENVMEAPVQVRGRRRNEVRDEAWSSWNASDWDQRAATTPGSSPAVSSSASPSPGHWP
jgi:polar amino acid transport system ATP-binding protein